MKNKLKLLFSIVCSLLLICAFSACKKDKKSEGSVITLEKQAELSLNKTSILLEPGATVALEPTLSNVVKDDNESFVWKSYDTNIATVENGVVTAREFGSTYISVNYGLLNAKCKVNVRAAETSADELQLKLSQTAVNLNAVYENAKSERLTVTAYKNGETVQTEFIWESDNSEYVTVENGLVTALKNGGTANVTVRAIVEGTTLSAVCKVSAQDDITIALTSPTKALESKELYQIPFSVTVNGEIVDADPSWHSYDQGVATVLDGIVTAVDGGKTIVEATYGHVKASIDIVVRSYVYVSTAEQFLSIGDGDECYTYILTNNIDFGAYFAQNIWLNEPYLIENFRGILDGKGYAITGLTRYCDGFEREVSGVFSNIAKTAVIKNVYFGVSIKTGKTGSLFAGQMSGKMENCYINIELNSSMDGQGYSLFSSAIGSVSNTIVEIESEKPITAFALYGFLKCENCLVITSEVACGGRVNGQESDFNPYFENCYLYESTTALLSGNGYTLLGSGKGNADTQKQYQNFASDIWNFDGVIALKNELDTTPIIAPTVIGSGDKTMDVTEKYIITDETVAGLVFDCYIVNAKGKIVHTLETDGNEFTTATTGNYTVVSTLINKDGVTGYHIASITVINASELVLTTKNFVLKQGQTATIAVQGKTATEFNYYSSNEQIVAVDQNGVVSAQASGTAQVRLVHKTAGLTALVTVDIVNVETITEISTAEELLAIDGATGGYYLLKKDITLTWTEDRVYNYEFKNDAGDVLKTERYARMIERFDGTLDGNGYTITVYYETADKKYIPCGLFYRLGEQSTVKNLHYIFNGQYARTDMADYTGLFASRCYGKIQDCYLQANVRHLEGSSSKQDQEGFIAVATKASSNSTVGYYNSIFHLNITNEKGITSDSGYAIRYGSGAPMVNNCVFIRNGATKTFYGTDGRNGSACEMRYSYFYRTVYDFVYAKNGSTMNTARQISNIPDNSPVYSLWDARWNISEKGVYLLGRKIADAQYESYGEAPVMEVVHTQRLISWGESGTFEVTLNGEYVGSSSNGSYDIYSAIAERFDNPVGSYDIVVENLETGVTGIAIVKIIGVTQDNFVDIVRQTQAEKAHYIFVEDIKLSLADFTQKKGYEYYVCAELRTPLDGNGRSLTLEGDISSLQCGAVFYDVYATVENIVFRYNVTRLVINDHSGCFANKIVNGAIINSYLDAVVTPVDANGNVVNAQVSMVHFGVAPMTFRNNIVALTVFDEVGNVTEQGAVFYKFANGPMCEDSVFIHTATQPHFAVEPANGFAKKMFYYTSIDGFIQGNGFVSADVKTFVTELVWTATTTKAYSTWGNVWTVENGKIYLCGQLVYPEPRSIDAILVGNLLTMTDNYKGERVYDIYVGGEKAVTFTGATCNIVSLLEKAGKIRAGENAFEVTVKTASGTNAETRVALKVYGINGINFVTTVRTAQENVGDWYYVMIEDVTIDKSAYGQTYGNNRLVTTMLYVNIDGNGHSLTVQGDISDNVNGAVFGDVRSTVQNLRFYYNVTRREAEHAACFALFINNGGLMKNCYLEANVKLVDSSGNMLTSLNHTKWAMIHHINDAIEFEKKLVNIVSKLTIENVGADGVALVNLGYKRSMAVGCVVIGQATVRKIANTESGIEFDDCYYYDTLNDFVFGANGKYLDRQITNGNNATNTAKAEWTEATDKAYNSWSDVWTIDETGIKLCGASAYSVKK